VHFSLVRGTWEYFLEDYPNQSLVNSLLHIIDFGANLGFNGSLCKQSCHNLKSATEFPEFIKKSVVDLLCNGHALGPFIIPPYLNFRCSPLGSVTRPHKPLKCCLINHLSWPHGFSINDSIPDSEGTIKYEAFEHALHNVASSGKGTLLAKLDLKDAFHHIPVCQYD